MVTRIALTVTGKACLAVLAFAVILWVTEALPFAVTSLFVPLLIPAFGIADYATVVAADSGNPIITFFIGHSIVRLRPVRARRPNGPASTPSLRDSHGPGPARVLTVVRCSRCARDLDNRGRSWRIGRVGHQFGP